MSKGNVENIRNIAVCGHGSSGKTTLVDKLLVKTGAVSGNPGVDDGSSVCDFDPEEKHHKYTIEAKVVHFGHSGYRFHLLDTPGYPDFIGQTIASLRAVELTLVVINAHSGIEVNTRRVFDEAGKAGIPRAILINKMDSDNLDFPALVDSIRELWGNRCALFNVPVGQGASFHGVMGTLKPPADTTGALIDPNVIRDPLIESIIEVDEQVMERYFEGEMPDDEQLARLTRRAVVAGTVVPILCCSAKSGVGLDELLEGLEQFSPSPADVRRAGTKDGNEVDIAPVADGPLVAQVFRTRVDPFVQKLSFIRVFSGVLRKDMSVNVSTARKPVKLGPLLEVQASETHAVDEAGPGDIIAIAKMDDLHTGSTIGDVELPPVEFPTPMVGLAVMPKSRGDETKLSGALHKIVEEDPTFRLDRDSQTKELVMTGMSELHLTIIRERLLRRDRLEVETKEPKIPFRETIQQNAEGMYRHKKQTGGRGQFGEVHIRMFPLPRGTEIEAYITKERFPSHKSHHYDAVNNFLWVDSVVGGVIPGNFLPAIEKGFKDRLTRGVIAGYQVQDLCVEVHFGKHHPVDSSEAAFKTAGSMAFKNVFLEAKPCLLEPVVNMEITVPENNVGDVYSDMSSRGGRVVGSDSAGGNLQTVRCVVPLREVTTYARTLSSITGGQGSYTMEFDHYEVMPGNVQQEIMAKAKVQEDEEE
ncbi:MAG: elongation factor G [Planctomycetes bacterium]|nr:elongation factor G [Planctomycetota bacterium]